MGRIKIRLFNKLSIESDGVMVPKLETRKAEELLSYLLINRDSPHTRERLADILWEGDLSPEQSKGYLRKALWQLQSQLDQYSAKDMIVTEGEWLQINSQFEFWLDIAIFENAFRITQGTKGCDLNQKQFQITQFAVENYKGDLLDGWFQDWCMYERERFQFLYLSMLDKLMDHCEASKKLEDGLVYGHTILRYDHAREHTHRRLMKLYYLSGNRTAALRQYERCILALHEELDVGPAESTRSLKELIADDNLNYELEPIQTDQKDSLHFLLHHLTTIQKDLGNIQSDLTKDIRAIQRVLTEK
jgi:DNA-binding SARP family transcriptional activator